MEDTVNLDTMKMQTRQLSICLALVLVAFSFQAAAEDEDSFMLFSLDEASELGMSAEELRDLPLPLQSRGSSGPEIALQSPPISDQASNTIELKSPANLRISFAARQADVDMSSLEVKAKKGFVSKSLTKRLMPYIAGTEILADGIELPSGRFVIIVAIADLDGDFSEEEYRLIVND
jgi:hypothetical protein